MARARNKLTAKGCEVLARTAAGKPRKHADGGGLYLRVGDGRCNWVFLFTLGGKARSLGLGPYPQVPLADARRARDKAESLVRQGASPKEAAKKAAHSFGDMANAFLAENSSRWANAKHRAQWRSTLSGYAAPLWPIPVNDVDMAAILSVLQPIWRELPETASRLRGRVEAVLDYASVHGHRSGAGENPARWKGRLDKVLPPRGRLTRGHHAAMPYQDMPAFLTRLKSHDSGSPTPGMAALALEFLILTAGRTGEVVGARWEEMDLDRAVWTVPAARMKAGREHRVPLSARAVEIVEKLAAVRITAFVFPGYRDGAGLSSGAMAMLLRRMGVTGVTCHGFRASYRSWIFNETDFPRELAEESLSHVIGNVERSYRRSDALEKRRVLMNAWSAFLENRPSVGNVVILRG